jgi:hypothetical protein
MILEDLVMKRYTYLCDGNFSEIFLTRTSSTLLSYCVTRSHEPSFVLTSLVLAMPSFMICRWKCNIIVAWIVMRWPPTELRIYSHPDSQGCATFPKNLEVDCKFWMPVRWHEACSVHIAHRYKGPEYKNLVAWATWHLGFVYPCPKPL